LLEFVFGAAIALAHRRLGVKRRLGFVLLALGIVASFYLRAYPPATADSMQMILSGKGILYRVGTWGLAAAGIVAGTVFWSPRISTRLGLMAIVLGNASYSAYLSSQLVEEFTIRFLLNLHPHLPLSFGVEMGIQMVVLFTILGAGWVSYQFMEWPLVRLLQKKLIPSQRHTPARSA
jgi:peptidoglycan/LPS O-acetylase OafA/YrhL